DYVIEAVLFIANHGHRFLSVYDFDLCSGTWTHQQDSAAQKTFSLDAALSQDDADSSTLTLSARQALYDRYLEEAARLAEDLGSEPAGAPCTLDGELGALQFFALPSGATRK
ncbi:MAG: hypothetical protein HKN20_07435, partial [Gemmatimonadetes bacterium]|nr:hypothetical protein [Gemmatimonadota bacterium]